MPPALSGRVLVVGASPESVRSWEARLAAAGATCVSPGEDADAALVLSPGADLMALAEAATGEPDAVVSRPGGGAARGAVGESAAAVDVSPRLLEELRRAVSCGRHARRGRELALEAARAAAERDAMEERLRDALAPTDLPPAATYDELQAFLDGVAAELARATASGNAAVVAFDAGPPGRPHLRADFPALSDAGGPPAPRPVGSPDQRARLAEAFLRGRPVAAGALGEAVRLSGDAAARAGARPGAPARAGGRDEDVLVAPIVGADGALAGFVSAAPASDAAAARAMLVQARRVALAVERARADRGLLDAAERARVAADRLEEANDRLRETAEEAGALYRASRLLLDAASPELLHRQIVDVVRSEFGYTRCALLLVHPTTGAFALAPGGGERWVIDENALALAREALRRRVAAGHGEGAPAAAQGPGAGAAGTRSSLAVPLVAGSEPLAVLVLKSPERRAFDARDERILVSFAERAALALHQARLHEAVSHALRREAVVHRITAAIRQSLDLQQVFEATVEMLGRELEVDRCVLYQVSAGRMAQVAQFAGAGVPRIDASFEIGEFRHLYDTALRDGEFVANDVADDERLPRSVVERYLRPIGTRALVFLPIVVRDVMRAVLVLADTSGPRRWSDHELAVARDVAEQVSIAVYQAQLFEWVSRAKIEWESTFDAISDGIFIFDPAGRLARLNRTGSTLADVSFDAIGRLRCCELLKTSGTAGCAVEEALASGRRLLYESSGGRMGRPTMITVDVLRRADGTTAGAVCVARDLTTLREAEAEARRQHVLLAHLVENAYDAIFAVDLRGRVTWLNGRACELVGAPNELLVGRPLTRFVQPEHRRQVRRAVRGLAPDGPTVFECAIRRLGGERRDLLVTATLLFMDRRLTGILGVARDVTDERRTALREATASKLRALGRLAAGVAHDFNNILAAILGNAQLVSQRVEDPDVRRRLGIIELAARDGAATVRRIQEFARQRTDEAAVTLDLMRLIEGALEITRTRWEDDARSRGAAYRVTFDAPDGFAPAVVGHESQLREVFVNIIFNAIEAMPTGGALEVSCRADAGEAVVRFADSGVGVPAAAKAEIFEPFYTTKGEGGTGLGLAVSYAIVARHGGRIEVADNDGRGAAFSVHLPVTTARPDGTAAAAAGAGPRPMRVLVIDDEESVREVLADMLSELGHEVTVEADGPSGLDALAAGDFSVLFTDLAMPEMDGWEVARRARARRPALRVVLVTGYGGTVDAPGGEELVDEIVSKPFDFPTLADVCARLSALDG